uniref:PHD-type domain-containing protein n=1 Tax=Opuntia streptacantha TaxID=393608 RepID=A0A7C9A8A3_OPUST
MTGDSRCRGPTRMMGRGADGGCGTEEKTCPVSRLSPAANIPAPANEPEKIECVRLGVDLYTQALKALSERSPFDSNEVLATTVPTLPSGLASLLSKHADSRKKHKRPHSDTKSRKGSTEKSKSSNVWVEVDDYFRELTLQDIERLCRLSSSYASSSSSSNSCFSIPVLGHAHRNNNKNVDNEHGGNVQAAIAKREETDDRISDCIASDIQELNGEIEQHDAKVDCGNRDSLVSGIVEQSCLPQPRGSSQSCSSVEWVLGSRNRVLLTTTRPTKKRKLLGETAGLEKLIVAQPCEGSSSLCHVCSMGDTGDQLNQLVVCNSCNVVVHQKCYGVQGEVDTSWLCAWCKHIVDVKVGQMPGSDRPCVLCPKTGGAVKRFQRAGRGSGESIEFAHLFCSQWMPEVYIDDTRLMEPLLSIEEIKDVRGKLLCNLCKVRVGSCVRCSDGMFCSLLNGLCIVLPCTYFAIY